MNKKEKLLFIKYVYDCIKMFEGKYKDHPPYAEVLLKIKQNQDQIQGLALELKKHLPNDQKLDVLLDWEVNYSNIHFTDSLRDKEKIHAILKNIDLSMHIDEIKQVVIEEINKMRQIRRSTFQLSEVIYQCLMIL